MSVPPDVAVGEVLAEAGIPPYKGGDADEYKNVTDLMDVLGIGRSWSVGELRRRLAITAAVDTAEAVPVDERALTSLFPSVRIEGRPVTAEFDNYQRTAIWIDPSRQAGNPCLMGTRIPVETVVHQVAHDGVDGFMESYDVKDRRHVLVACAWWTLYFQYKPRNWEKAIQKAWVVWADRAWSDLWHNTPESTAAVPDPPEVSQ